MENNNQTQQSPAVNTIPPQAPTTPQTPIAPEPPSGESNKMVLWLVIGLVVIVVLVGGIYFFLSKQQSTETGTKQPVVQVTPKPQDTVDALDKDLNALNIESSDSDFASIDQDLQQL